MSFKLYGNVKILKRNISDLVNGCEEIQTTGYSNVLKESGSLYDYSLYIVKMNNSYALKLARDGLEFCGRLNGLPSVRLEYLTQMMRRSTYKGNKGKLIDYFYKECNSKDGNLYLLKEEDFYKTKTKDLFIVDTSEYAGYDAKEFYREGYVLSGVDINGTSYLTIEEKESSKNGYSLNRYKNRLIKELVLLNIASNVNREIDITPMLYDISVGKDYYKVKREDRTNNFKDYVKLNGSGIKYYDDSIYTIIKHLATSIHIIIDKGIRNS